MRLTSARLRALLRKEVRLHRESPEDNLFNRVWHCGRTELLMNLLEEAKGTNMTLSIYTHDPDHLPYMVEVEYHARWIHDADYAGDFSDLDEVKLFDFTYHCPDGDVYTLTAEECEVLTGCAEMQVILDAVEARALEGL